MNETRVWQGLFWKETKQIVPLIGMLFAVSAFLILVWASTSRQLNITLRAAGDIVPLIMPALFAAGAGAILVSHEKETRSLRWLASLPIPTRPIVATKLVVAFGGLIAMWIGCGVLSLVAGLDSGGVGELSEWRQIHPAFWFLHSVYVLLCGFYTSWRNKNAFPALVWIIPLALLPFLFAEIWFALPHSSSIQYTNVTQKTWVMSLVTLFAIPIAGWFAYRAGLNDLQADEPEKLLGRESMSSPDAWRPPEVSAPTVMPFRDSLASLVWQNVHGSPWMSIGLSVPLLAGAVAWLILTNHVGSPSNWELVCIQIAIGLAMLAVSWLGVAVFAGDGSAARLKFLADRGVSPWRAWVGRHWFAVSLLSATALLIVGVQSILGTPVGPDAYEQPLVFEVSLFTLLLVFAVVYGVSQWTSQVVPMLAASAFLAPVLSLVALALLVNAGVGNGVRLGWLLLVVALPFIGTWWTMRDFMDGRRGRNYWSVVVVSALLFSIMPSVPVWIAKSRFPAMSEERVAELLPEARRFSQGNALQFTSMRMGNLDLREDYSSVYGDIDGETAVKRFQQRDYMSPETWMVIGDQDDTPLRADTWIIQSSLEMTSLAKLQWKRDPSEQAKEELAAFVDRLTTVAKRLRLSVRWYDQEMADYVEEWLVENLSDEALQPLQSEPFFRGAVEQVGAFDDRQKARRRALLASWYIDRELPGSRHRYGVSANDDWFDQVPLEWRASIVQQGFGAVVDQCLWILEKGKEGGDLESEFRSLHELLGRPGGDFETGPYGDNVPSAKNVGHSRRHYGFPAVSWFEPWENEGREIWQREASQPQIEETKPAETNASVEEPNVTVEEIEQ
ncbi:ABC-2 transporter permease [Rhodopirellula halodulae]|uniref:ABC-2 transporter permease n=1 Tax=Rhodopirellula halodulae TaxID=2894198 RepID=UPI001E3EBFCB|nr:ABC-2 transporter permease [Rhodopirellula sp. JC737]MCC9655485.1 ABC-2 transporter permease [Rhodopirellula sp. JC737]